MFVQISHQSLCVLCELCSECTCNLTDKYKLEWYSCSFAVLCSLILIGYDVLTLTFVWRWWWWWW